MIVLVFQKAYEVLESYFGKKTIKDFREGKANLLVKTKKEIKILTGEVIVNNNRKYFRSEVNNKIVSYSQATEAQKIPGVIFISYDGNRSSELLVKTISSLGVNYYPVQNEGYAINLLEGKIVDAVLALNLTGKIYKDFSEIISFTPVA